MKKICLILAGFLVLGLSAFFIKAESAGHPKFVSYNSVITQNKPGFIYFYSDTCKYCVAIKPIIQKLQYQFQHTYAFTQVDVDSPSNAKICNQHRIYTIPAISLYNPKNKKFSQVPPYYFSETALTEILTNFADKI